MRNPVITTLIVFALLTTCSIMASCTVMRTVTVNKTFTTTQQPVTTVQPREVKLTVTVTRTITTTIQGVVTTVTLEPTVFTPIFGREAPDIPHAYILELVHTGLDLYEDEGPPVCFCCHMQPVEHELWLMDAEVCEECHKVSNNPILTPN